LGLIFWLAHYCMEYDLAYESERQYYSRMILLTPVWPIPLMMNLNKKIKEVFQASGFAEDIERLRKR